MLRFLGLGTGLLLSVSVVGCGGESTTVPAPATRQVQAHTYVAWSEGPRSLYAVFGVPDRSRFGKAEAENPANYRVEPPLEVVSARLLTDGITVCLTTTEQAPGSSYEVAYVPTFTMPGSVLMDWEFHGFGGPRLLTAVAVDRTHVLAVVDRGHADDADLGNARNYRIEPATPILAAERDGTTVRLTTAEQDPATPYRLNAVAMWMGVLQDMQSVQIVR